MVLEKTGGGDAGLVPDVGTWGCGVGGVGNNASERGDFSQNPFLVATAGETKLKGTSSVF